MTVAPTTRWSEARPSLAPRPIPFVSGLPRDVTQTMVATTVQMFWARGVRRSRMESKAQPAKATKMVETTTAGAPMCWVPA